MILGFLWFKSVSLSISINWIISSAKLGVNYRFHDILPYSNLPYANLPYTILSYIPIYPIPIYPIPFYPIIKAIETYPILLKNPKQYISEQIKEPLIMIKE